MTKAEYDARRDLIKMLDEATEAGPTTAELAQAILEFFPLIAEDLGYVLGYVEYGVAGGDEYEWYDNNNSSPWSRAEAENYFNVFYGPDGSQTDETAYLAQRLVGPWLPVKDENA